MVRQKARHLNGINAKRIEKVRQEANLTVDEPIIDALALNKIIEPLLVKIGPLRPDKLDGTSTADAELPGEPSHAMALCAQARRKLRFEIRIEHVRAGPTSRLEGPMLLQPLDLLRKPDIEASVIAILDHIKAADRPFTTQLAGIR